MLGSRPLTRFTPSGTAGDYVTYSIKAPLTTHWRSVTCAEMCARADDMRRRASFVAEEERAEWLAEADKVDCGAHRNGWSTTVALGDDFDLLKQACAGLVDGYKREAKVVPVADKVQVIFESGQMCLQVGRHKLLADRPEVYLNRLGDWRADLGGRQIYDRPDQWVDDFETHVERIKDRY